VISVKTASVHVAHILRKLNAPNRLEAAAIAPPYRTAADTPDKRAERAELLGMKPSNLLAMRPAETAAELRRFVEQC
jgi:hypothetical protein